MERKQRKYKLVRSGHDEWMEQERSLSELYQSDMTLGEFRSLDGA